MIEEVPVAKRMNRRTRSERNRRRERYLLNNDNCQHEDTQIPAVPDTSTDSDSSACSADNNNLTRHQRQMDFKEAVSPTAVRTPPSRRSLKKAPDLVPERAKPCRQGPSTNYLTRAAERSFSLVCAPSDRHVACSSGPEMKSEGEPSGSPVDPESTARKVVALPKKPKKQNFFIKKLKLRAKSRSVDSEGHPRARPRREGSPAAERRTPEGDDNLMFAKSVSAANLTESWKSVEDLSKDKGDCAESSPEPAREPTVLLGRTKSLENLEKIMPAYGDLILDAPSTSNANKISGERKDHLYKILVIGDLGAGKTSIIKRYVHRFFTQHYRATIGVDFALKVLNWDENTLIRLQLWDIAGQERYGNMTRVYYKEALGAFIVFDVTRATTFESVAKWKADLDSKVQLPDGSPIPCVLLANKCDQPMEGPVNNASRMEEYCKENGFTAWFETSAKDNINIDEAARALVSKILENDILLNADSNKDEDRFSLAKETNALRNGKSCSC